MTRSVLLIGALTLGLAAGCAPQNQPPGQQQSRQVSGSAAVGVSSSGVRSGAAVNVCNPNNRRNVTVGVSNGPVTVASGC